MYHKTEKRGRNKLHYLVESIRSGGGWKKIKVYLGSNLTESQVEEAIRRKRSILEKKVERYIQESDPLSSLISEAEKAHLETIRKGYKDIQAKSDPFQKESYLKWFGVQFTYDTSAIEGITLSLMDTKLLLEDKIVPKGKSLREINEVQNHKEAFDYMVSFKGSMTTGFVLALHKKLMHNVLWKQAGMLRDVQVYISGSDKRLPKPGDVPRELKKLMIWYGHNKRKYHPVVVAAHYHAAFESIHPFRDGNGRVGRLILNFMLKQSGYPMIDIKCKDRTAYYQALQAYDKGDLKPMARLLIGYLKEAMKNMGP